MLRERSVFWFHPPPDLTLHLTLDLTLDLILDLILLLTARPPKPAEDIDPRPPAARAPVA